ncbi:MAG TPA: hypothetical protein VJZ25_06025 [Gemmatimonadaceae bacterium]|nr:hypothetical protein [Gemmatimonadaceae bacterium]
MSHLSEDRFDQLVSAERARDAAPLNTWETIAQRAREEGLIREHLTAAWLRPWMRAAAALLILAGGVAIGRYTDRDGGSPATVGNGTNAVPAAPAATASFSSVDEAWATLDRASTDYQAASAFLAANNSGGSTTPDSVSIYRARLAALEELMRATASARESALRDPVINQYYLATLGAREATRQQLGAVTAASLRLKGF